MSDEKRPTDEELADAVREAREFKIDVEHAIDKLQNDREFARDVVMTLIRLGLLLS